MLQADSVAFFVSVQIQVPSREVDICKKLVSPTESLSSDALGVLMCRKQMDKEEECKQPT